MRLLSLAFLSGILLLQTFSHLPSKIWIIICLLISILLRLFSFRHWKYLKLLAAFLIGFAWCTWFAYTQTHWTLPSELEGKDLLVTGHITSLPNTIDHRQTFLFSIKHYEKNGKPHSASGILRLSMQDSTTKLHPGDEWQFQTRLKKIHGTQNPGTYDYEAWALQQGIRANGYIIKSHQNKLLSQKWYHSPINQLRQNLKDRIEKVLPLTNTSPWIIALILGERQNISEQNWEVLRKTGTNHLMAIAGLHIGFMSGFIFFLVSWCWRRIPNLALYFPAQHAGAIASLAMALFYSALAGFLIPTQRACIMLTVFIVILLLRRNLIAWHAWSLALVTVLLINPLSVLTESFWLSFGAVAFIIYGVSGRLAPKGLWWKWGRIQWVIAVGLIPFSIWLFQQCSIISFIANSVSIPWVGFLIVPLGLIGAGALLFSETLGGWILIFADKLLSFMWDILTWFANLSWSAWYQVMPNTLILIVACIGVILLLLPRGFPGRYLGFIGFLPLLFYQPPTPATGECWLTLLDVGQGLATVVQTKNHFLVFDTGAKLSANFDMGASVVAPYLRIKGAKKLDMLVISHGDNDHIGGAKAVMRQFEIASFRSSDVVKMPEASYCLAGEKWTWDNVTFEFIYPTAENLNKGNDSSCVLRITTGNKHALLTGDIEKYAERQLVNSMHEKLQANILIAPHHGSKTSGEMEFIKAVNPEYVLFPVGYRNRYHFPHHSVVAKYDALGVKQFNSIESGAIQFTLLPNNILKPSLYRVAHQRYWNDVSIHDSF